MQTTMARAHVTDANKRYRGVLPIELLTSAEGIPVRATHDGRDYTRTGRDGTNLATGLKVFEMSTEDDARIWVTGDGRRVFED